MLTSACRKHSINTKLKNCNLSLILEYNPKLSEATPTTRVAYVKFMAHAMRRESTADGADKNDTETDVEADKSVTPAKTSKIDKNKIRKSILRSASKASAV